MNRTRFLGSLGAGLLATQLVACMQNTRVRAPSEPGYEPTPGAPGGTAPTGGPASGGTDAPPPEGATAAPAQAPPQGAAPPEAAGQPPLTPEEEQGQGPPPPGQGGPPPEGAAQGEPPPEGAPPDQVGPPEGAETGLPPEGQPPEGAPPGGEPPPQGLDLTRLKFTGYVRPLFVVRSTPNAIPRDRFVLGVLSSRSGLFIEGTPYPNWSYFLHIGFDASVLNVNNFGATRITTEESAEAVKYTFVTSVPVENAQVSYKPFPFIELTLGRMRIPFSPGIAGFITHLLFPARATPTSALVVGPDDGGILALRFFDERLQLYGGLFDGSSLAFTLQGGRAGTQQAEFKFTTAPVWAGYIDIQPLGKMAFHEGAEAVKNVRASLAAGGLYRVGTVFDEKGYEGTRFNDARFSISGRLAAYGLYLHAEYLRRLQIDQLSSRPQSTTGFFAQGAFFYHLLPPFGLGPLLRYSVASEDEQFARLVTKDYEFGIALYPRADQPDPGVLRIVFEFDHTERTPFNEYVNTGAGQVQLKF